MTRALSKRRAQIAAELTVPLPPVSQTLDMLEALATRTYETKARTSAALKLAHRALRDLLQEIEADACYPDLMSCTVAEALHRRLRRSLELDKPKRFPSLPQVRTAAPATAPEVTATATTTAPEVRIALGERPRSPAARPVAGTRAPSGDPAAPQPRADIAFERETGQRDDEDHARAREAFWRPTTRPSMPARGAKLGLIRKHIDLLERIDAGEHPTLDPEVHRVLRFHVLIIPRDSRDLTPQRSQESSGPFRLTFGVRDDIIAIRRAQARRRQRDASQADSQRQLELLLDTQHCATAHAVPDREPGLLGETEVARSPAPRARRRPGDRARPPRLAAQPVHDGRGKLAGVSDRRGSGNED